MNRIKNSTFLTALLWATLFLFATFPIMGIVLDEYSFELNLSRPIGVFIGIFLLYFTIACLGKISFIKNKVAPKFAHKDTTIKIADPMRFQKFGIILICAFAAAIPLGISNYWLTVSILALIYILLGLGLNIVVGMAGLLDLGFVAFYAVGAYTYALGHDYWGLGFWTALPLAALFSGIFGAVLAFPVLRMHGDYLAIVTLGFGEIIHLVLNNWFSFTGGPNGVSAPPLTLLGLEFTRRAKQGGQTFHDYWQIDYSRSYHYMATYWILLLVVFLVLFLATRLKKMPLGRSWEALREDEIAARSLGINHVNTKLSAFSMGAAIGGLGGVFFAAYQGFVTPSSFTFIESALILAVVVLGGMGSIPGVIIAAVVVTLLPEILREFSSYRMLLFGAIMVLMMIWRPQGLLTLRRSPFSRPGG